MDGTAETFFKGISDFADFGGTLFICACRLLVSIDMAGFPVFSTLAILEAVLAGAFAAGFMTNFASALTEGVAAGRTTALKAGVAFGFPPALDCVVCGFFEWLGLAIGMRPPDVGNSFK
ncbi:hypothetical protein [Polaromonas sp.]|uniref:hypothetical protein n=1 Tax=Polaromonas sp. TaxID=1869339 RepID=UPI0025F64FAB|nr:hypothetical protein [Polaromonas sp.]